MGMKRMFSRDELKKIISEMSSDLIEVTNIKQLSDEECNVLKVGDIVAKKTGEQYHCYIVTFKQDKVGLCLSYFDASCIETQSYDYTNGHWVYNSEDKADFSSMGGLEFVEISGSMTNPEITIEITQKQYQKLLGDNVVLKVNDAENGSFYMYKTNDVEEPNMAIYSNILTNVSLSAVVEQVETEGAPEYAVVITSQTLGGGTKLYKHTLYVNYSGPIITVNIVNTSNVPLTIDYLLNASSGGTGYSNDKGRVSFEANGYLPYATSYQGAGSQIELYSITGVGTSYSPTALIDTDTVTEL